MMSALPGWRNWPTRSGEGELLVLPYGSTFPKDGWTVILAFFRRGGRWVQLGGAPLTRPVRRVAAVGSSSRNSMPTGSR